MANDTNQEINQLYNQMLEQYGSTPYPGSLTQDDYKALYDSIRAGMGDDATLKANIEAALRPMYDQSVAQLQQQRIANNAAIDVDAASRGMGNSTWVTDAKLRQLRGEADNLASLNANYNNQLYTALQNAIGDRDANANNLAAMFWQQGNNDRLNAWKAEQEGRQNAYNQALQMYQLQQAQKSSGRSGKENGAPDWLQELLERLDKNNGVKEKTQTNTLPKTQQTIASNSNINDLTNPPKGVNGLNRAIVNTWNYTKLDKQKSQYTK